MRTIDISRPEYDEWLRLVFDHPVSRAGSENDEASQQVAWYLSSDLEVEVSSPARLVEYFTRLCHEFRWVADDYTLGQIDQGLCLLLSQPASIGAHLAEEEVPLSERLACARAMARPYADFVASCRAEVMENAFDMWWDMVCGDFWTAQTWRLKGDEIRALMESEQETLSPEEMEQEERIQAIVSQMQPGDDLDALLRAQGLTLDVSDRPEPAWAQVGVSYAELPNEAQSVADAMLDSLCSILRLPDERCQSYALHGLGHLRHPKARAVVQKHIQVHRGGWSPEMLAWAESCRDGTVM
jgi:hypothetical protein